MHVKDVLECAFPSWYAKFEKVTVPSLLIPVPDVVITYLLEDDLVLPRECNDENYNGSEDDYDVAGDVDWGKEAPSAESEQKSFPKFSRNVVAALSSFGGEMFCKLNWSSPKDAAWIGFNNSTKCTSLSQLYLLLKSSDFIAHDLTAPFKFCEDAEGGRPEVSYALVLRQWLDVNPGTEFRCFVVSKELKAISQRDDSNFYDYIASQADSIQQDIVTFFHEHIQSKFKSDNYVFDVIRSKKDIVILVDFNPFGRTTDSIFFSWDELEDASLEFEFRYSTHSSGVQGHPFRHYGIPRDFVDLSAGLDPLKLIDFLKLNTNDNPREESDSD